MIKYYCILAHTDPGQVNNLIEALSDEFSKFYIHIDAKCDINPFMDSVQGNNVYFIDKRYQSAWGSLNLVLATIEIFKTVILNESEDGFFILLSGSDYPLKSNKFITNFFIENSEYDFIDIGALDNCWPKNQQKIRLVNYNFFVSNINKPILSIPPISSKFFYTDYFNNLKKIYYLIKSKNFFEFLSLLKKRKNIIVPYGGSQWFSLKRRTVKIILDWIINNPEFLKSHKFTFIPDELVFQSIIKHIEYKNNIKTKGSLTYVNWTRKNVKLPLVFTSSDIMELKKLNKDYLFARKFHIKTDQKIFKNIELDLRSE